MAVVFSKSPRRTDGYSVPLLPRLYPRHRSPPGGRGARRAEMEDKAVGVARWAAPLWTTITLPAIWWRPHTAARRLWPPAKRALPDDVVFTYQGDGDLAAIGTAETVHAATRGETSP